MHPRPIRSYASCALALAFFASDVNAQPSRQWSTVDHGGDHAQVIGITNSRTILGSWFTDDIFQSTSYVQTAQGQFTELAIAGAVALLPGGINNAGTVAATYLNDAFEAFPFLRAKNGAINSLPRIDDSDTFARDVSDNGLVAGEVQAFDPDTFQILVYRGVVIDTTNDNALTYHDYPGLPFGWLSKVNAHGSVIGNAFSEDFGTFINYIYRNGAYTPAAVPDGALFANHTDLNNREDVVGYYGTANAFVGYIENAAGQRALIEYPGLAEWLPALMPPDLFDGKLVRVDSAVGTVPLGVNERRDIVGMLVQGYAWFEFPDEVIDWVIAPVGFKSTVGGH